MTCNKTMSKRLDCLPLVMCAAFGVQWMMGNAFLVRMQVAMACLAEQEHMAAGGDAGRQRSASR